MFKIGLVGRTNVGKSTLFNRLLGSFRAIVTDVAGTTRELLIDEGQIGGYEFQIIDSPGLEHFGEEKQFIEKIVVTSDLLIFVVDRHIGIGSQEEDIAQMIFHAGKKDKTMMLVNKLEQKVFTDKVYEYLADCYGLGFETVLPISARQGEGMENVMEEIVKRVKGNRKQVEGNDQDIDYPELSDTVLPDTGFLLPSTIPFVIVGRPNVGKSTLMNSLVGEYVAHVQDQPGTTLDYIKSRLVEGKTTFELYDTAGIRKQAKIVGLERIAYEKTKKLIEYVKPIIIMMIDGVEGVTQRDLTILGEMINTGYPIIIALNKADGYESKDFYEKHRISKALEDFDWIQICTISGKEKTGLTNLMQTIRKTRKMAHERLDTPKLNDVLKTARIQSPPRFPMNKICKWKYISQVSVKPTVFYMSVNNKDFANFSFIRRCQNVIRKEFGLKGIPLQFTFSSKAAKNPFGNQTKNEKKKHDAIDKEREERITQ